MKRHGQIFALALAGALAAGAALPVPDEEALETVRADVENLTRTDYTALERGGMTHGELAASLLDYARNAEDPAAIYLLRRAAFRQHLTGGDIAAAEALYDRMARDGGLEYAQALARFSSRALARQVTAKTPGAKELFTRLAAAEKKVRAVESARAAAEQTPDDLSARERYGAALAVLGDWPGALAQFARLDGREGALALFERRYPRTGVTRLTTADVADRWWNYPETAGLAAADAAPFRLRAAKWYRLAVTNGVLRGVRRQLAEKRAEEAEAAK